MGMVHGITEPLLTTVHFSVVLLGVVPCSRQVVEACAPRSYGSPEGEECLQYAGLRSKVSVVAVSGLRAGCVCLLLNGLMLRQIVLGPVQISESIQALSAAFGAAGQIGQPPRRIAARILSPASGRVALIACCCRNQYK